VARSCCGRKWARGQVEARLANLPPCLIGMEACVGVHHLSRKLQLLGDNARLMPAKCVRPYSQRSKQHLQSLHVLRKVSRLVHMQLVVLKPIVAF
jgi:transposase